MEVTIEKGVGFVSAEEMKEGKEQVGQITVDAIFSPVKAVNFDVENMRVGERTDYDKLTVEVETDGSISPEEAFVSACDTLVEHFNLLKSSLKGKEEKKEVKKEEKKEDEDKEEEEEEKKEESGKSLDDLDLTSRVINILKEEGLTPEKIKEMSEDELKELSGIGKKSAERILKSVNS